jgi:phytoene dehydrogenase-like protein
MGRVEAAGGRGAEVALTAFSRRPNRQFILDKLKRTAGMPDLEERIVFERTLTPQDIHGRYTVLDGAICGLFLAGGATHPRTGDANGANVRMDCSGRA